MLPTGKSTNIIIVETPVRYPPYWFQLTSMLIGFLLIGGIYYAFTYDASANIKAVAGPLALCVITPWLIVTILEGCSLLISRGLSCVVEHTMANSDKETFSAKVRILSKVGDRAVDCILVGTMLSTETMALPRPLNAEISRVEREGDCYSVNAKIPNWTNGVLFLKVKFGWSCPRYFKSFLFKVYQW
jgi:hypothetical protein